MQTQHAFDVLTIAQSYREAGVSIIPITPGEKKPWWEMLPRVLDEKDGKYKPSWKPYQARIATEGEVKKWCAANAGIGIVGGEVSGGLLILDLESYAAFESWLEYGKVISCGEVIEHLPVVKTGKGYHVYWRCEKPGGNRKLAMHGREVVAETRGEGGYVLAPPTRHPSGSYYTLVQGDLSNIPTITQAESQALLDAARALSPSSPPATESKNNNGAGSVIDLFNESNRLTDILSKAGYRQEGNSTRWIRPGGERSSIIVDGEKSIHFNSNDPLCAHAPGGGYYNQTAFSAWCKLEHEDDIKGAVREAAKELGLNSKETMLERAGKSVGLATSPETEDETYPYFMHNGGIWMQGEKGSMPLCNFDARIIEESVYHDGDGVEEYYTLNLVCSGKTRQIKLPRVELESEGALAKITSALGARARINPKAQARVVIDAIKSLSTEVLERNFYTYTGWANNRYMFGNGYIDQNGWHQSDWCELPQRLNQYHLTPGGNLEDALVVLDYLLESAPPSVVAPVVGGILLSPVRHLLDAAAPMVHVYGITGTHKTAFTCAAMSLWGNFTPAKPTDSWSSTGNSIQKLGWHLKDAPLVLDDYKIANVRPKDVTFLLQNYGDQTGRGRLDANSTLKNVYPIRGIIISSGEDQPEGEASTLARILSVELRKGAVDRSMLSLVQSEGGLLHAITIDYIQWLCTAEIDTASIYEPARTRGLDRLEKVDHATNAGRIASNIAVILTAWEIFLQFLGDRGYWSPERIEEWRAKYKKALFDLALEQIRLTTQERYSQLFLDTIQGLLVSGKVVLEPDIPEPGQTLIGKKDQDRLYLISSVTYDEVVKHMRASGRTLGASNHAISRMLQQDGLLLNVQPPNLRVRARIRGSNPWCWVLPVDIFDRE
jgi:hypothetical protein